MKNGRSFLQLYIRRMLVVFVLLSASISVNAATVLQLRGNTSEVKNAADSELRLSVLRYSNAEDIKDFIKHYKSYGVNGDHEAFIAYLKSQQTKGYVFTKEATGYSIKYAWQNPTASKENMVFVITPALKSLNPYLWNERNTNAEAFTVLELNIQNEEARLSTSLNTVIEEVDGVLRLKDAGMSTPFAILHDDTPYYLKQ